jgi:hypothetical protein
MATMTAEPIQPAPVDDDHALITQGGQVSAVVVPIEEYRCLRALARIARPEDIEEAEMQAAYENFLEWDAAGRPGGTVSHEEAAAELLRRAR